jgi:hypothetical protein
VRAASTKLNSSSLHPSFYVVPHNGENWRLHATEAGIARCLCFCFCCCSSIWRCHGFARLPWPELLYSAAVALSSFHFFFSFTGNSAQDSASSSNYSWPVGAVADDIFAAYEELHPNQEGALMWLVADDKEQLSKQVGSASYNICRSWAKLPRRSSLASVAATAACNCRSHMARAGWSCMAIKKRCFLFMLKSSCILEHCSTTEILQRSRVLDVLDAY